MELSIARTFIRGQSFVHSHNRYTAQTMALDLPTLRKLVSLDPNDPLSRFALGRKLAEIAAGPDAPELSEAADHLTFANQASPGHLATYHVLSDVLIRLN